MKNIIKNHGKCVGCYKPLKPGEFVVLNGGAMIKTRSGAMMGDKKHLGFLTVSNHFDAKKNYRSLIITDNAPNGQFEFYACSHKCLADFISRQIMHLDKFDKIKKIELAPQSMLDKIGYDWGLKVVNLIGFKKALITDQSTIGDFINDTGGPQYLANCWSGSKSLPLEKLSEKLGFKVKRSDYIWQVAKKYKNLQTKFPLGTTQAKYAKPLTLHKCKCSDGCGATVNVPGKCLCCSVNN